MAGDLIATIEAMPPGPEMISLLATARAEPIWLIAQWDRVRSWVDARSVGLTASLVGDHADELEWRSAQAELAVSLSVGELTAGNQLGVARDLVDDLPSTVAAMESGEVSLAKARVIAEQTADLGQADRAAVEAAVLPEAAALTCGALRKRVRAEVVRIDAAALLALRKRCEADRSVRLAPPDPGGMTVLSASLTHDEGLRAWEAVRAHAERAELRQADAFVDLLTGGQAPIVQLIVRASADGQVTTGDREPLDEPTLRSLVTGASAVVVRPIVAPAPEPRYRPSRAMRDYVVATQPVCRFPHCERVSERCDLDHVTPYDEGGATAVGNLIPLCRHHHRLKTFSGWRPSVGGDGSVIWTDPNGNEHLDRPPD